MTNITIIGAGMAGLLAGNMLRRHEVTIMECQPSLPNNHHAVLRFRTRRVSEQTHIPFSEVKVFKACDERDPIRAAMLYSQKVLGRYEVRSLIDLEPCSRFIAPLDFIEQMARGLHIQYETQGPSLSSDPVISTMPMPALMDNLDYHGPRPTFLSHAGYTLTVNLALADVNVYATRYYADPDRLYYRASITGDRLVIEFAGSTFSHDEMNEHYVTEVLADFGLDTLSVAAKDIHYNASRYAKLGQLSPEDRRRAKDFMFWASSEHNVYSLGRFATWRSGLLMDDVVDDVFQIERWISGSRYDMKKDY